MGWGGANGTSCRSGLRVALPLVASGSWVLFAVGLGGVLQARETLRTTRAHRKGF